jgi:uncharacterized FlgJ-related protein
MTTKTITVELTIEQAEDIFDCINVASLHYAQKAVVAKHELGSYDWRVSSADKLKAYEDRRDLFTKRWVEFYQVMKVIRADEKAIKEGREWLKAYRAKQEGSAA